MLKYRAESIPSEDTNLAVTGGTKQLRRATHLIVLVFDLGALEINVPGANTCTAT